MDLSLNRNEPKRAKTSDSKVYALNAQFFREKCCSEPMRLHYSHVAQWRGN